MNRLATILHRVVAHLEEENRRFAIIGGLAVSVWTEPRFTRDIDLAVAVTDDEEAEATVFGLRRRGYEIASTIEQDAVGRLATARLLPPNEGEHGVIVDLLFASSGIEQELVRDAHVIEIMRDVTVPLADIGHLIALKILSRDDRTRPQDLGDIRMLLSKADEGAIYRARTAVQLIMQRGFHRGRALVQGLEAVLAEAGKTAGS